MNKIKIRKVTNKDVEGIVKLHRKVVSETNSAIYSKNLISEWISQITEENIKKQLRIKTTSWYLLELDNKIVGFCQFPISEGIIYQLNIDPNYQGNGYGKILYEFMERKIRAAGVGKIKLNSTLNAKLFYEKLGFTVTRPIKFKIVHSEMDMLKMAKILA